MWKTTFYMLHYDSRTPKRTCLWSNCQLIAAFWKGKLSMIEKERKMKANKKKNKGFMPVKKYIDKKGKRCYQGTADLTATGYLKL